MFYYESAEGELEYEILLTPIFSFLQPDRVSKYSFQSARVKTITIEQTSSVPDTWTMSEISLMGNGSPIPDSPGLAGARGTLRPGTPRWRSIIV